MRSLKTQLVMFSEASVQCLLLTNIRQPQSVATMSVIAATTAIGVGIA